jgi:hypothetical protein
MSVCKRCCKRNPATLIERMLGTTSYVLVSSPGAGFPPVPRDQIAVLHGHLYTGRGSRAHLHLFRLSPLVPTGVGYFSKYSHWFHNSRCAIPIVRCANPARRLRAARWTSSPW